MDVLIEASRKRNTPTSKSASLNNMSGTYADPSGRGWLIAARMGAEIEIAGADHQNKLDIESMATRSSSQPLSCASAWPRLKRPAVAAAPWQRRLRRLFPMQLERLTIKKDPRTPAFSSDCNKADRAARYVESPKLIARLVSRLPGPQSQPSRLARASGPPSPAVTRRTPCRARDRPHLRPRS